MSGNNRNGLNLTSKDIKALAQCYIPVELARLAGIRRVDSAEGASIVGQKPSASRDFSGLVIPYFLPGESRS